jgi:lipoprotein signal peptidase
VWGYFLFNKDKNNWLIKGKSKQAVMGLELIIAGGVSNLSDWFFYAGILNTFNLGPLSFNVADAYILIGIFLFLMPKKFSFSNQAAQP